MVGMQMFFVCIADGLDSCSESHCSNWILHRIKWHEQNRTDAILEESNQSETNPL